MQTRAIAMCISRNWHLPFGRLVLPSKSIDLVKQATRVVPAVSDLEQGGGLEELLVVRTA
ncbi:MAG: hypothetical protein LBJ15_11525 [Comamonas sp.]|jgi:hypothetical protein|uniref:hypothetical protein n=1 Tax=Comamonas sp. TaxID=34028 RepID=UPI0028360A04|nr:hypothetical protein [Comamonas sp.]MDR0214622.1 hypothetical protein [Comamonas sp.]